RHGREHYSLSSSPARRSSDLITISKVCLSGLDAIALAAQLIRAGEFEIVVAGGMESMTRAPHLLPGARTGHKFGPIELADAMALDRKSTRLNSSHVSISHAVF